jgi:hypothetical protein
MEIEERTLPFRKPSHVYNASRLDAHSFKRGAVRDRRDNQFSVVLKPDEATVEQVVNGRGE